MHRESTAADVEVFTSWPDGGENRKVPSAISYSPPSQGCKQWGNSIDQDSRVLQWTKLELPPREPLAELTALLETLNGLELVQLLRNNDNAAVDLDIPRHITKSPFDIVKDFLSRIAREFFLYMRGKSESVLRNVPLDIVLTHPAVRRPVSESLLPWDTSLSDRHPCLGMAIRGHEPDIPSDRQRLSARHVSDPEKHIRGP